MGIDHVGGVGRSAQVTYRSRHLRVQSYLGRALKEAGQEGLTRATTPPCLSHTARRCHHSIAPPASCLDEGGDLAIPTVKRNKAGCVKYEAHLGCAGPPLGLVMKNAIRLGNLGVGQWAELLFPGGDCPA
jgi:hypothetical protein